MEALKKRLRSASEIDVDLKSRGFKEGTAEYHSQFESDWESRIKNQVDLTKYLMEEEKLYQTDEAFQSIWKDHAHKLPVV